MNRHFRSSSILLTFLVILSPIVTNARGRKIETYDGAIDFGAQLLHLDGGCLSVEGTVKSGSFFDDLKRIDAGSQFEYRKGGIAVAEYPEFITTSIRIMGDSCERNTGNTHFPVFGEDSYSLTFQVAWKDGMQLAPAMMSPAVAHCVGSRVITNASSDLSFPAVTCQMTIKSKGVPLGDHLIVSVFAPDGKRLTRLSAAP